MKSLTDAFFTIGKGHEVCQDYAVAGEGRAMLADGCSSSPNTDVGARLLCHALYANSSLGGLRPGGYFPRDFDANHAAACAAFSAAFLTLPLAALDATLLYVHEEYSPSSPSRTQVVGMRAAMYGDGCIVARRRGTQDYVAVLTEYSANAPYYLSYAVPGRLSGTAYRDSNPGEIQRRRFGPAESTALEPQSISFEGPGVNGYMEVFPREDYDLVLLLSDGVTRFRQADGTSVPPELVIAELLAVKQFTGAFIQRRAARFLRDCPKWGWSWHDDFSVAAIYLPDVEK
jgi:hypothetical protein